MYGWENVWSGNYPSGKCPRGNVRIRNLSAPTLRNSSCFRPLFLEYKYMTYEKADICLHICIEEPLKS